MSFKKYYPNIIDNIEYTRVYSYIYNTVYDAYALNKRFLAKGLLTTQDITDICQYQCSDYISDQLLSKAIKAFGEVTKNKLYRGLSKAQKEKALALEKCALRHISSFSTDWTAASNFADGDDCIMTIQSCSIKIFDLSYFVKVIEQIVTDFNMDKICDKYGIDHYNKNWFGALLDGYIYVYKNYPDEELLKYKYNRDVKDFRVNEAVEYDEQEWLVPANTVLADVDREKLIFKII